MQAQLVLDRPTHPTDDSAAGFFDCRGEWQPLDGWDLPC